MIFVTVGTHEQPFNRLVKYVDELKRDGIIDDDVFIQTGYCTYKPEHCQWAKFLSYKEMTEKVKAARIVITHGGPSSFIMPLQMGKTPIVVPRQQKYGEHVNDHQVWFCKEVSERIGNITVVSDINDLNFLIESHNEAETNQSNQIKSNTELFNHKLQTIIEELFAEK